MLPLFRAPSWTVTDLTRHLRSLIESDPALADAWVLGEVSNFTRASSGHLYFTIKDSGAALRCVMWRNAAQRLQALPRDGDAIEVHGLVSIYEANGVYQLYADTIRPAGEGALYQEFLRLKARLETEGLFDDGRKRPIPRWPHRIGIVTSPTGAALRDLLNTLRRRFPAVEVVLAPTPVQGSEAPPAIVQAIRALNRLVQPDVILLARGGGSIEDLWAFNDESVARAIAASQAPVITGVGHETDFTIADFAADLRAPTPTAAAELATPNRLDLIADLDQAVTSLSRAVAGMIKACRWGLNAQISGLQQHTPAIRLRGDVQQVDDLARRTGVALAHFLTLRDARLNGLEQRMHALNPLAILERGYAVVSQADGKVIHRVSQAVPGQELQVRVSDGSFLARVERRPDD